MIHRIAIRYHNGHAFLRFSLQGTVVWSMAPGFTPIPGGSGFADPGPAFYFDGWRLGGEDVKMRIVAMSGKDMEIHGSYGGPTLYEVWLSLDVPAGQTTVQLRIATVQGQGGGTVTLRTNQDQSEHSIGNGNWTSNLIALVVA